jgi:hypothetical protein
MRFEKTYDVIVAGAGVAGVAAALAAARHGRSVALVEKTIWPGGLATSGLVVHYLPICDGRGEVVFTGMAEELLLASIAFGPDDLPADWRDPDSPSRYRTYFSPAAFVLALDDLLERAGVQLWYDTVTIGPVLGDGRVEGIEVFNKSGPGRLLAPVTIDATGDADLALAAGETCMQGDSGLSCWSIEADLKRAEQASAGDDGFKLLKIVKKNGEPPQGCVGVSGRKITDFALQGRRLMRQHYADQQARRGASRVYPLTLPTQAPTRKTRGLIGRETFRLDDAWRPRETAVGVMTNAIGRGGTQYPVWEIPFGAMLPRRCEGLMVAGRAIAAEGILWDIARLIPPCIATGQIAGTAAALALDTAVDPSGVDLAHLRDMLTRDDIRCSLEALYGPGWAERQHHQADDALRFEGPKHRATLAHA